MFLVVGQVGTSMIKACDLRATDISMSTFTALKILSYTDGRLFRIIY